MVDLSTDDEIMECNLALARPIAATFSFVDPCCHHWEGSKKLRKLALTRKLLVKDVNGNAQVPPSLPNLRENSELVRAYTMCMASTGVILTNRIAYVKAPIEAFYASFEVDVKTDQACAIIYGTAFIVKKMLHVVKRKWSRWELPRVPGMHVNPRA